MTAMYTVGASHKGVRGAVFQHRESAGDWLSSTGLPRAAGQGRHSEQEGTEREQET